jgi:hypothetical protein
MSWISEKTIAFSILPHASPSPSYANPSTPDGASARPARPQLRPGAAPPVRPPREALCSSRRRGPGAPLWSPPGAASTPSPEARPAALRRELCAPGLICDALCSSSVLQGSALFPAQPQAPGLEFFWHSSTWKS